jgi:hypothetical protein
VVSGRAHHLLPLAFQANWNILEKLTKSNEARKASGLCYEILEQSFIFTIICTDDILVWVQLLKPNSSDLC